MMRWFRPGAAMAAFATLVALSGCEHGGTLVLFPEVDVTDSFESGLGDWTGAGIDLGDPMVAWSADITTEEASSGTHSLKLTLDNANAEAKIWALRPVQATPGQVYDVELSFDFGTADYGSVDLWRIIAGAAGAPPGSVSDLPFQDDTGNGSATDVGYQWVHKDYAMQATADADGNVYVVVGVWGTSEAARSYYVDNVHMVLTRTG